MQTKAHQTVQKMYENADSIVKASELKTFLGSPDTGVVDWVDQVETFHNTFGIPNAAQLTELPVSSRERRLRLDFEEFIELLKASGFRLSINPDAIFDYGDVTDLIEITHVEGSHQDLIEIADGIGDGIVVKIGHALEHGINLRAVFCEIMRSNMTKADESGTPLINHPSQPYYDESKPIGKILKSALFVPADIPTVITKG